MVIYFPDPRHWFERAVPLDRRQEFLERVEAKLDQIEGPIVMIASRLSDEKAEVDDRARLVRFNVFYCLNFGVGMCKNKQYDVPCSLVHFFSYS